jgi:hypothetical protein
VRDGDRGVPAQDFEGQSLRREHLLELRALQARIALGGRTSAL